MKILIFDPVGGASGDMILGSLLHLGCPVATLTEAWDALDILDRPAARTLELDWKLVQGIRARDVKFSLPAPPLPAGRRRGRARTQAAADRTWREIRAMLERAALPDDVREASLRIFASLAEAEAAVHGVVVDRVHFHEVGAVDSILDIVGIAAAVAWFRVEALYATPVPVGQGTVVCRHGRLPLPAPATVALLEGLPVRFTTVAGELTTPTGAAVLRALTAGAPPAEVILRGVGYGCGDRTYDDWPSLFRTLLADTAPAAPEAVYVLEADVDDLSPEDWELATARLYAAGALDVTLTARIMKRGRPGVGLTVLVPDERLHDVANLVLEETSTIGVRYHPVARRVLPRHTYPFRTPYGELRIKEVVTPAGTRRCKPEYADLQALAVSANRPVSELRREVQTLLQDLARPVAVPSGPGEAPEPPAGEAPVPKKKPARRATRPAKAAGRTRKKEPA